VISTTGAQMTWLALPWFVLITTGSATKTTFVVAAEVIGLALLACPAGAARTARRPPHDDALRRRAGAADARDPGPALDGGLSFPILLAVAFALGASPRRTSRRRR
jgi:hypothetical protein